MAIKSCFEIKSFLSSGKKVKSKGNRMYLNVCMSLPLSPALEPQDVPDDGAPAVKSVGLGGTGDIGSVPSTSPYVCQKISRDEPACSVSIEICRGRSGACNIDDRGTPL